jgi:hypothetical protein
MEAVGYTVAVPDVLTSEPQLFEQLTVLLDDQVNTTAFPASLVVLFEVRVTEAGATDVDGVGVDDVVGVGLEEVVGVTVVDCAGEAEALGEGE